MQTKYGVPKPSYRALQLLARLRGLTGLPVAVQGAAVRAAANLGPAAAATATSGTVDVISAVDATLGTTLALHALVTNYNINIDDTEDPSKGLPIESESGVTLSWTHLPAAAVVSVNATVTLLDATHGWAKPTWVAAGSPVYPSRSEIDAELAASEPAVFSLPVTIAGTTASVVLPTLIPYAVAHVVVEYAL